MELQTRRWVGGLIRAGLIVLALVVVGAWFARRVSAPKHPIHVQREAPAVATLAPGDLRIYSRDSTLDVVLVGDRIMTGLSPQMIDKIKAKMDAKRAGDTGGLGGLIASQVRSAVQSNIGTHVVYPLAEVRDLRIADGHLYVQRMDGTETELLGNVKVSNNGTSHEGVVVDEADAKRFIDAVHARKAELHLP
jgi:hypothetical protein